MASLEGVGTEKAMEKLRQEELRQAALDGREGEVGEKKKGSCMTKVVGVFVSAGVKVKILISLYQVLNGLGVIFNIPCARQLWSRPLDLSSVASRWLLRIP